MALKHPDTIKREIKIIVPCDGSWTSLKPTVEIVIIVIYIASKSVYSGSIIKKPITPTIKTIIRNKKEKIMLVNLLKFLTA
mgnify:CR=1 FL=1